MRKLYKSTILAAAIAAMAFIPLSSAQADSRHGVVDLLISNHGHHHYYDHDYYDYFPHGLSYSLSYSKHRPWYNRHHRHRHHGHHYRHKNKHHWKEHRGHRNKHRHREHRGHRH